MVEDDADGIEEGDADELVEQRGVIDDGGEHGVVVAMRVGFLRGNGRRCIGFICGY